VKNFHNCPFDSDQLDNKRPPLGKGMLTKKAAQMSTRVEYRGLSRGGTPGGAKSDRLMLIHLTGAHLE
jgi:hypothetical protein